MGYSKEDVEIMQQQTRQGRSGVSSGMRRGGRSVPADVREGWKDGALTVFVPGKPTHFKGNGHRYTVSKHTKDWRERAASRLLPWVQLQRHRGGTNRWLVEPTTPKRITFTIYARNAFDDDNLGLVCSPTRDALKDMGVIQDDRRSTGHTFNREQAKPTRSAGAIHGIAIRVELLREAPEQSEAIENSTPGTPHPRERTESEASGASRRRNDAPAVAGSLRETKGRVT